MSQKEKSIKANFIFNSLYQIVAIVVPIITLPYLSRTISAEGLGEYSYAYSVASIFYIFIRLGLHSYGNRTIAAVKDNSHTLSKVFFEIYSCQFSIGMGILAIYLCYCFLISPDMRLSLIFLLIVVAGIIDLNWMLYGLEEFGITSVRDIIIKVVTCILIVLLVKNENDVWKYALIYSAGFFISQVIVLPVIVNKIHYVKPTFRGAVSHIKPNIILFLPTIAVSIYRTMDKVMLGMISNKIELGYYHASENIIRVPLALVTALGTVALPRMTNMLSRNEAKKNVESLFDKSILLSMFLSSSICFGIMTVADVFVPLFYGEGFEKCIYLFYIILPSCIFVAFANVIRTQYLLPRKKDKLFVVSLFAGALANVIINSILIPKFESIGAAMGTLVAEIVVCILQAVCVFKEANIGRNILNSLPFVIAGVLMFVLFWQFTPSVSNNIIALLLKIFIGGGFYLIALAAILGGKELIIRAVASSDKLKKTN